jgi:hypothetical protein
VPAPPRDPGSPAGDAGGSDDTDDTDAPDSEPVSSRGPVAVVVPIRPEDTEPPPDSGPRPRNVREALHRFVGSRKDGQGARFISAIIVTKLYGPHPKPSRVDQDLVDQLTSMAVERALKAKTPPWTVGGIPGWVVRVTRCAIADYFRDPKRKKDRKNLARGVDPVNWADRHQPETDWGAREHLITKWLETQIGGDPVEKDTFRLMFEHNVVGRPLEELARENDTTQQALASRFYKLRMELAPKVSLMDREKPRRAILLLLFFGGLAVVVAILVALWRGIVSVPPPQLPEPRPVPSVSAAPLPTFDQAPPRNDLTPTPPVNDKPTPGKP